MPRGPNQGGFRRPDDCSGNRPGAKMYSAIGPQEEVDAAGSPPGGERGAEIAYQLPYLLISPRQTALRSIANDSFPTLAFFATAVITMTSLSSGSTKIDWP